MDSLLKWNIDEYFDALADAEKHKAEALERISSLSSDESKEAIEYFQRKLLVVKEFNNLANNISESLFDRILRLTF